MANINITTGELKKVLQGTGISEQHFLAKLSSIKMDQYKAENKEKTGRRKKIKRKRLKSEFSDQ